MQRIHGLLALSWYATHPRPFPVSFLWYSGTSDMFCSPGTYMLTWRSPLVCASAASMSAMPRGQLSSSVPCSCHSWLPRQNLGLSEGRGCWGPAGLLRVRGKIILSRQMLHIGFCMCLPLMFFAGLLLGYLDPQSAKTCKIKDCPRACVTTLRG